MAEPEAHSSRAEQRMLAVAKLKRAASLPRMQNGRRPPMHNEAVSEGEKATDNEDKGGSEEETPRHDGENATTILETGLEKGGFLEKDQTPEPESDRPIPSTEKPSADNELDADTELEERPMSPSVTKKRRSRSRSRSRGSKDFKGKFRATQSPIPQLGGDSSQDENPPLSSPIMLPMVPPLASPIPHFPFLQPSRFLRAPTPVSPEMSLFYPGTSPPTPLPTLEDLQKGLMRSNSAGGNSAVGRRMAMHKLTGGTETYDPSPSPTPPPSSMSKLGRNNTVSGGERIAARTNMLSRLGTRVREADAEASGTEDRSAPSPTPKRRRRRSRRSSTTVNPSNAASDSDFVSTNPNTPAVPTTPLPSLQDYYADLRAMSTTPNQISSSRTPSGERASDGTPPPLPFQPEEHERPEHHRRRSVLIEDPDEEDQTLPQQRYPVLPGTPQRNFQAIDALRTQASNTPSNGSPDSAAVSVPVFLRQRAPSRTESYPSSPFTTPLKERPLSDDDEEQVIYPAMTARPRTPYGNALDVSDREISWVASPVPEIRMPIDDDEGESELEDEVIARHVEVLDADVEEDDEEVPLSATSSHGFSPEIYDDRASSSSKSVLLESETSPENPYIPASPSSAAPLSQPRSDGSISPQFFPQRLSMASRIQSIGDRSPNATEFTDWEERYASTDSPKRTENASASTWEKVKSTFSRAGSSTGRRSRTNSIVTRERHSSISRESGASLTSAKTDKCDSLAPSNQIQAPPLMQTPSASASIQSLSPHGPPRPSVSPIPPASSADMSKYQNAKLFPFPGIVKLEEERRAKGYPSATASSPDVSIQSIEEPYPSPMSHSFSNPGSISETNSERKESTNSGPSSPYYPDYIDVSSSNQQNGSSYNLKLPTTLPGVKQWLSKNSKKKTASPVGSTSGSVSFSPLPLTDSPSAPITNKKPSLSDIFRKKENDLSTDWEDVTNTPTSSSGETLSRRMVLDNGTSMNGIESEQTPRLQNVIPLEPHNGNKSPYKFSDDPSSTSRLATATPDPSSISEYPAPTASESSSTSSSQYSIRGQQGSAILERIDENLARGFRSPMWSAALDDPPRKLILSSPVLQVVNPNTIKDRFLFLFNDILVIAKPFSYDQDNLMDTFKPSLPDRKYTVKSVVQLRNVRFCADRVEAPGRTPALGPRSSLIRSFISQFSKDPDHAIATLFTKSNVQDNSVLLGQLLFKTLDLDRSRLGEYLSRKTSKTVLKAYLDSFGFAGLRVDVALRVFLHSVNVSRHMHSYSAFEHLLDLFASRWYEANAKFIAYDKDMAARLVWALAQLNDRLHGPIADEPGPTDHILRTVTTKEFQDAFRRYDARYLVSDELLQELYRSIFHERLCQARSTITGSPDTPITIKRVLPTRLTYKTQSEPIVFRLPQPDPLLTIELYGQDLIFDPPILHFTRSSEASFRITGTSLGSKTMTMCRSGPNAIKYSGLPFSHSIVVERAFMRNTFQIAFLNQAGTKRRYMFSVDDPIIRNEWATCLRRQIDATSLSTSVANGGGSHGVSKFQKATQLIAFKVLHESLIGPSIGPMPNHRANGSYSNGSPPQLTGSSVPFSSSPNHTRSKSRSRVYHRHGAGKNELDLGHRSQNSSRESNDYQLDSSDAPTPEQRSNAASWTSRELEMHCQQNSSISLVLSFLQVGAPEHASPQPI